MQSLKTYVMNGKVFLNGKTFAEACQYVLEQSQAQVLYGEGVRTHDYRLMAEDFEWQHHFDDNHFKFSSICGFWKNRINITL